jgi:hypothetical protein
MRPTSIAELKALVFRHDGSPLTAATVSLSTLQQIPGDDQAHDFVGAFVDLACLGVPEVAFQGVSR